MISLADALLRFLILHSNLIVAIIVVAVVFTWLRVLADVISGFSE